MWIAGRLLGTDFTETAFRIHVHVLASRENFATEATNLPEFSLRYRMWTRLPVILKVWNFHQPMNTCHMWENDDTLQEISFVFVSRASRRKIPRVVIAATKFTVDVDQRRRRRERYGSMNRVFHRRPLTSGWRQPCARVQRVVTQVISIGPKGRETFRGKSLPWDTRVCMRARYVCCVSRVNVCVVKLRWCVSVAERKTASREAAAGIIATSLGHGGESLIKMTFCALAFLFVLTKKKRKESTTRKNI